MEPEFINKIINFIKAEDFMPHGQCLLWKPGLLGLHVASDIAIVLAYYTIPLSLIYLVKKREDLSFGWIFMLFGLFIFLCGTTHLVSVVTIWKPFYWIEGWLKLITALVSVATAICLWPLIPKALALPSSKQLKEINDELSREIEERLRVEEALKISQGSLEKMVEERTAKLQQINESLKNEIVIRESAEMQLSESKNRLETIFKSGLDAILMVDEAGKILQWNTQAEEMFGWLEHEVLGKPLVDTIIPSRYREAHLQGLRRFFSTGEAKILNSRIEIEALNRKNEEFQVELLITFSEVQGKTFIAFMRDITERKTAQKEMILAKEEAESSNQAKSEFLARMSHELRTPMNAILGFGQLFECDLDFPLPEKQQGYIQRILKSGNHLLNLINEVLDLSKVESGVMELSLENVSVKALITDVLSLVSHLAEEAKVKIDVQSNEDLFAVADYNRLKQVFLNLISNAIKYNKIGGSVFIKYISKSENIHISVSDTGKGIPKEKQGLIFQPFTRVDPNLDEIEGTGIGLTISERLVKIMKGKIYFESEFGKGTTFTVEFPEGVKRDTHIESEMSKIESNRTKLRNKNVTILYIEDNPDNLDLVEQIMTKQPDIVLISAADAETGVEMAKTQRPDLILMDIHLPGMDGLTAFQRLKNYNETVTIPVIALSADAMQADKNKALALGFNAYLTKPINIPEFMKTISEFLV